ncbi:hypothetical protein Aple_008430 [Acrocarpospora pleiomorpha]|uniref:Uncharacterized protein n=1 Tax=Acrocarpospora pleiomorpha TaxID=90975 RepID=A0A5M3XIQ9_9ACTN|nr:hypothetical protein Aple_008430 [Acrocarpospora pleiomorpha]
MCDSRPEQGAPSRARLSEHGHQARPSELELVHVPAQLMYLTFPLGQELRCFGELGYDRVNPANGQKRCARRLERPRCDPDSDCMSTSAGHFRTSNRRCMRLKLKHPNRLMSKL